MAYWHTMRKDKKYDLILDGAHFTDWRIKKLKFTPLVKIASVVSFTLVSHTDNPILEADELIGKRVAVLSPPSMGSLKLAELFKNPMRQPVIISVRNSQEAVKMVETRKVVGAVIPTRMVGGFPFLVTVQSMEQMPHMALSASSRVPVDVRNKIKTALLDANKTAEGKKLLEALVLEGFEPATPKLYDGFAENLKNTHGY
jgi:ABC-type phosphate/phosphonate transport system substrate-binding protein